MEDVAGRAWSADRNPYFSPDRVTGNQSRNTVFQLRRQRDMDYVSRWNVVG